MRRLISKKPGENFWAILHFMRWNIFLDVKEMQFSVNSILLFYTNLVKILFIFFHRFEHDVLMKKKQNFVDFSLENLDLGKHTAMKNNRYKLFHVCDISAISQHNAVLSWSFIELL